MAFCDTSLLLAVALKDAPERKALAARHFFWDSLATSPLVAFEAANRLRSARLTGLLSPDEVTQARRKFSALLSGPVRTVHLSAFLMPSRETTWALWKEVRTWAETRGYDFDNPGDGKADDHPVHSVSWNDAVKWCHARSEKDGLVPCYYTDENHSVVHRTGRLRPTIHEVLWSANGYRLPTEAEWEKAARGGMEGKRFPWGDSITHAEANYYSDQNFPYDTSPTRGYHPLHATGREPFTAPVGSFPPNEYGLYDMTGNVWEWCWDAWSQQYYESAPDHDPRGPAASSTARIMRGGSWSLVFRASSCRVANRDWNHSETLSKNRGFRTARNPEG
jgi:sulfatase modifying factor 1